MNILFITSVPISYPGGMEKVIRDVSSSLSSKHTITVLQTSLYMDKRVPKYSTMGRVKVITCVNDLHLLGFGYSSDFKRTLKRIWDKFDVVHVHGHGRFTSAYSLKFLKGKLPVVYTAHGFFHSKRHQSLKKLYNKAFAKNLRHATFCTALTMLEEKEYLRLGVSKQQVVVIPNGIDSKSLMPKRFDKQIFLKSLGLMNKRKTLLYVGRVHQSKGLQYVIQALEHLDINFVVAGPDAGALGELKGIVQQKGMTSRVKFLGKVSQEVLAKLLYTMDLFVMYSEWEGFGIATLEAMACGLPVLVSDRGALPSLVTHYKNGFVVPYEHPKKLRVMLEKALSDVKLLKKMGLENKKKAKRYELRAVARLYEKLYKKAVQKGVSSHV